MTEMSDTNSPETHTAASKRHESREESWFDKMFGRLGARYDRIEFAKMAEDIRYRVGSDYSVFVDSNEQRIVVARKVPS